MRLLTAGREMEGAIQKKKPLGNGRLGRSWQDVMMMGMSVTIDLSKSLEEALRAEWGDLEQAAKEALLIESYRQGKISVGFLAQTLGIGVVAADRWLAERGVNLNYSREDFVADQETMKDLFGVKPE